MSNKFDVFDDEHNNLWWIAGGVGLVALTCGLFFLFRWLATPPGLMWAIGAVGTLTTAGFIKVQKAKPARLTMMLLGVVLVPGFPAAYANQQAALVQQVGLTLTNRLGEALTKPLTDVMTQQALKSSQVNTTPQAASSPCKVVGTRATRDSGYTPICQ